MKLASFDIEIARVLPPGGLDWAAYSDLGISCAAVAFSDREPVRIWSEVPRLERGMTVNLAEELLEIHRQGYRIVTWNGCGFDFRVLAEESGMWEELARLAMEHVDLMLMVTFTKGHYLSLQAALEGAGLAGKLKQVQLSNGSILEDMDGAMAPLLWSQGEEEAVLAYLEQDVRQQLALAEWVEANQRIQWTSRRGNLQVVPFPRLLNVEECFDLPEPDTSWMRDPPSREGFVAWMRGA